MRARKMNRRSSSGNFEIGKTFLVIEEVLDILLRERDSA